VEKAAHPIPGRRLLVGMLIVFLAAALPGVVIPTLFCREEHAPLPDHGTVPPFSLIDQTGAPFTDAALRGKVTIVDFVFTRCDNICPVLSMKMARIQEKTFDLSRDIKLVSISVDPSYDTPEKLTEYAKKYGADPERWRFVTGPYDKVYETVEKGFMTSMMRVEGAPSGKSVLHQGYFLLLDPALHIRGIYDSDLVNQLDALMRDARYLVRVSR
jgi:protein SCO1/2